MKKQILPLASNFIKLLLVSIFVYLCFKFVLPLFFPFIAAAFFATLFHPLFSYLHKRFPLKPGYFSFVLYMLIVSLIFLFFYFIFYNIYSILNYLYCQNYFFNLSNRFSDYYNYCCENISNFFNLPISVIHDYCDRCILKLLNNMQSTIAPFAFDWCTLLLKNIGKIFTFLLITGLSFFIIFKDYNSIVKYVSSNAYGKHCLKVCNNIIISIRQYLSAQIIIILIVAVICSVTYYFIKAPSFIFLGITSALLDALPFIGSGIVFIPLTIYNIFIHNYISAAISFTCYILCSITREILEPHLIGKRTGIRPLFIIISVYCGMRLFGIIGIFYGPIACLIIYQLFIAII